MERYVTTRQYEATYTGKGEFYSGVQTGARVLVREEVVVFSFEGERKAKVHLAIQSNGGAWLVIYGDSELSEVTEGKVAA